MGGPDRTLLSLGAIGVFALVYACGSLLVGNQYYQLMLTLVPIWAVMGLSWNMLSGYTGLVSFGHASFFGLGAYTVTLLDRKSTRLNSSHSDRSRMPSSA